MRASSTSASQASPAPPVKAPDEQTFLQAMYKEQYDQTRQHETLRQQSTTLIFALAGTMATVAGAAVPFTATSLMAAGMHWGVVSLCATRNIHNKFSFFWAPPQLKAL